MATILISKVGDFRCFIKDVFVPDKEGYCYFVQETGFYTRIEKRAILHARRYLKKKREMYHRIRGI